MNLRHRADSGRDRDGRGNQGSRIGGTVGHGRGTARDGTHRGRIDSGSCHGHIAGNCIIGTTDEVSLFMSVSLRSYGQGYCHKGDRELAEVMHFRGQVVSRS